MAAPRELRYRLDGPATGLFPGAHRSRSGDAGFEFRGHAPLRQAGDVRRLDLLASLRDPFGQWQVRQHSLRKTIAVVVVADLSASMNFQGGTPKPQVLADLVDSLAWSAWRQGDSFGFVGCDDTVPRDWLLPATRGRGAGMALAERLRHAAPDGRSARGLLAAHAHLPQRRSLVFLVSDFHLPLAELDSVLASLARHAVVPVVLWQPQEFDFGARAGWLELQEPESRQRRWLWWRPALRARWQVALAERRLTLQHMFVSRRLLPLWLEGGFDADAVTRHFVA